MRRRTLLAGGIAALALAGAGAATRARLGSAADYDAAMAALRAPLPAEFEPREAIRFATLAANGHNTQPWRFRIAPDAIDVLPDFARRTPVVDADDHHLWVSLGCAAANLALAAAACGRAGEARVHEAGLSFAHAAAPAAAGALVAAIPRRQSTRAAFSGAPVAAADLAALEAAARVPGVHLALVVNRPAIGRVRDLVVAANSAQMRDPAFVAELIAWIRFNPRSALAAGDGLYAGASGNPALPDALGRLIFPLAFRETSENAKYAAQLDSAAGVAVFVGDRADRAHWVRVGEACQRFVLQATALGLSHAFVNQPVEVPGFRAELAALAGAPGLRPDLAIRFGTGPTLPYAPRRPVEAVMET